MLLMLVAVAVLPKKLKNIRAVYASHKTAYLFKCKKGRKQLSL
jgi:hypothetical protein